MELLSAAPAPRPGAAVFLPQPQRALNSSFLPPAALSLSRKTCFFPLVALLLFSLQPQNNAVTTRHLFSLVQAMPVTRGSRSMRGGQRGQERETLNEVGSNALSSQEEAVEAATGEAAVLTSAAKAASLKTLLPAVDIISPSAAPAAVGSLAPAAVGSLAAAASTVVDWTPEAAAATHAPREQQQQQRAASVEDAAAAFEGEREEARLLAPAGAADIMSTEEQVDQALVGEAAADMLRHPSIAHTEQQPSSTVLGLHTSAAAAGAPSSLIAAPAARRNSLPAAALLTPVHSNADPRSGTNARSSTSARSSTREDEAAASGGIRKQSIRRHLWQKETPSSEPGQLLPQRRGRREGVSEGIAGMIAPYSSGYDSGFGDGEEEDMGLSSSDGFGRKLREAISCPASKILIGIGGAVAVGTLGVKYTRALLKRRRRHRLQQRPPTPFSDLLGHVLLTHEQQQQAAAAEAVEGVLCSAKEKWRGGSGSSKIIEAATADVLGDPGSVTALYFTSSAVEEMLQQRGYLPFTARLEAIAAGCKRRGQKFNVVYVSADTDSNDAGKHFAQMPWYAVPYDDAEGQEIAQRLYRRFRVSTLPHVVLLDSEARVINPQAYASMLMDPAAFPWRKKSLRELLGDTFVRPNGEKVDKAAVEKKVLGLYFSASWCPPCQAFTPNLVSAAEKLREQGKSFEIVFISNDRNKQQFDEYFKKMDSFLAVPFEDTNKRALLQETLNIRSLPTLVWVGGDDEVLTRSGVAAIAADSELKSFPFKEPDVHEVAESVEGIAQDPALILFMEYADPAEQQKQRAALDAAAAGLRVQKRDGGFPPVPLFFTAMKISPRSTALRRICKQHELLTSGDLRAVREQQAPVMVIVDLIDQSYYLYKRPASTSTVDETSYFTADEITAFVRSFRSEKLERNPLVLPE